MLKLFKTSCTFQNLFKQRVYIDNVIKVSSDVICLNRELGNTHKKRNGKNEKTHWVWVIFIDFFILEKFFNTKCGIQRINK